MTKTVRFVVQNGPYMPGELAGFPDAHADRLVAAGVAEESDTGAPVANAPGHRGVATRTEPPRTLRRGTIVTKVDTPVGTPAERTGPTATAPLTHRRRHLRQRRQRHHRRGRGRPAGRRRDRRLVLAGAGARGGAGRGPAAGGAAAGAKRKSTRDRQGRGQGLSAMPLHLVTPPALEPVSVAELKAHAAVDGDDQDAMLAALIGTARTVIERRRSLAMITQVWAWSGPAAAGKASLALPLAPVRSGAAVSRPLPHRGRRRDRPAGGRLPAGRLRRPAAARARRRLAGDGARRAGRAHRHLYRRLRRRGLRRAAAAPPGGADVRHRAL